MPESLTESDNEPNKQRLGEFPFPITKGGTESKYLSWVRNHSSYLAVGGFLNGIGAGAVYVRGVLGNLLILLPFLIVFGILLGFGHYYLLETPLRFSQVTFAVGIVSLLLYFGFDIGKRYSKYSEEKPFPRNRFGWFYQTFRVHFMAWIGVSLGMSLLIDLSPLIIEFFRKDIGFQHFGLKECAAGVLAAISSVGVLLKYLPKSVRYSQPVLMILAALISFAIVWGVTLRIANYVYYGLPPYDWRIWTPYICVILIVICQLVRIGFASAEDWRWRTWAAFLTLALGFVFFLGAIYLVNGIKRHTEYSGEALGTITRPLAKLVKGLNQKEISAEAGFKKPILELMALKSHLDGEAPKDPENPTYTLTAHNEQAELDEPTSWFEKIYSIDWLARLRLLPEQFLTSLSFPELKHDYYGRANLFLEYAETLSDIDDQQRDLLLRQLSRTATEELLLLAKKSSDTEIDIERAILQQLLAKKLKVELQWLSPAIAGGTTRELELWLGDANFLNDSRSMIKSVHIPISLAKEYLSLIPSRKEKELPDYEGKTSPDVALSGPPLISSTWANDDRLLNEVEVARLRHLLCSLSSDGVDSVLQKLPDAWFATRRIAKSDFDSCEKTSHLSINELALIAMDVEMLLDVEGIFRMCQLIEPSTQERGEDGITTAVAIRANFSPRLISACRLRLIEIAMAPSGEYEGAHLALGDNDKAAILISELYDPEVPFESSLGKGSAEKNEAFANQIYARRTGLNFTSEELIKLAVSRFVYDSSNDAIRADTVARRVTFGRYGNLQGIATVGVDQFWHSWLGKVLLLLTLLASVLLFCWLFVNPNATSVNGFYRRKLATAFIVGPDATGRMVPDSRVLLSELNNYAEGNSTAPYHLINVAINMQGSDDPNVRDRNADFFVFSKNYVGSERTGYIATKDFEIAASDVTASTAMSVSAGAASPNMGQYTQSLISFLLTMVNVRLGYWIPNPRSLKADVNMKDAVLKKSIVTVFPDELADVWCRRRNAKDQRNSLLPDECMDFSSAQRSTELQLFGVCLSGGGIRSAAINFGNLQVLQEADLFRQVDYLSTVSGGGYVGTGLSAFMRSKQKVEEEAKREKGRTTKNLKLRKRWRPRARLLYREMVSRLHDKTRWVNVSDGGHVENLGAYELLRRRCQVIIVGEGESDPNGTFPGLSTLMRLAEIDMNIRIAFPSGELERLVGSDDTCAVGSRRHFAIAEITYPMGGNVQAGTGYLIYVRSSLTGTEDRIIKSYNSAHKDFPHESTLDQMFNEGQFEAYRRLGIKMMRETLASLVGANDDLNNHEIPKVTYAEMLEKLKERFDREPTEE